MNEWDIPRKTEERRLLWGSLGQEVAPGGRGDLEIANVTFQLCAVL